MSRKRDAALDLLEAVEENIDGEYDTGALVAIGWALLDVADAIREQTAALAGDDKRTILIGRNQ